MTIQARLADGRVLEFPDGTDPNVIQSTVKRMITPAEDDRSIAENILSVGEPLVAVASSAIAEPVAGIAGLLSQAGGALGLDVPTGADVVESTREALTFQPKTQAGQEGLQAVGESLAPVGEFVSGAEDFLGDKTFELTGSPTLAAAAATLPTAALEAVGFGVGRRAAKVSTGLNRAPNKLPSPTRVKKGDVSNAIVEAAPDIDQLKTVSRGIYNEIDDLGVTIQPKAYQRFVRKIVTTAKKERVNKFSNPKAFGATQEFIKELDNVGGKSLADIDDLRKIAQDAAGSIDPADARIGMLMIDEIDGFLDVAKPSTFRGINAKAASKVGESYKAARNLWGRARRAELMQDAMTKADRGASGFENGLRVQLRQIVNNKKRSRFFTKAEISAMDDVIKGTGQQNALKLIGRLGFSEGGATNILGGLGGFAVLGPAAPVIGQVSRKLAQRAAKKGFDLADAVIRSGSDGKKITNAYLRITPKAKRSAEELSTLLTDPKVDLKSLLDSADKLTKESAEIARGRRAFNVAETAGALAPAATAQEAQ